MNDGFVFAGPVLMREIIGYVQEGDGELWQGLLYAFGILFAAIIQVGLDPSFLSQVLWNISDPTLVDISPYLLLDWIQRRYAHASRYGDGSLPQSLPTLSCCPPIFYSRRDCESYVLTASTSLCRYLSIPISQSIIVDS